jgi:hypothetical protein
VHHLITSTAATSAAARPPRGHNLPPSRPRPPRTTISTARARLRLCRATCRPGSATTSSAARWWCGGRRARAVTVGFRCSAAARPAGARGQPGIPCSVLRLAGGRARGGLRRCAHVRVSRGVFFPGRGPNPATSPRLLRRCVVPVRAAASIPFRSIHRRAPISMPPPTQRQRRGDPYCSFFPL